MTLAAGAPDWVVELYGIAGGIQDGLTSTGELRVRKEDGTIAEVHSGEVSVRGLYSYV